MKHLKHSLLLIVIISFTNCFSAKGLPIKEVKDEPQQTEETVVVEEAMEDKIEDEIEDVEQEVDAEETEVEEDTDSDQEDSNTYVVKVDHSDWDALLKKYVVDNGNVDYKNFKNDTKALNEYVNYLSTQVPAKDWSVEEQLAYFINVYNANTIKLIVDNYPTKSIKDIKNPWLKNRLKIGNEDYSLADIENGILRKMNEPRIHFAINCASFSCPKLLNTAYTADNVEELMERATREFVNNTSKNNISKERIKISEIFKWYKGDFTEYGTVVDYINKYSDVKIFQNAKVDYINYDWNLNEQQ